MLPLPHTNKDQIVLRCVWARARTCPLIPEHWADGRTDGRTDTVVALRPLFSVSTVDLIMADNLNSWPSTSSDHPSSSPRLPSSPLLFFLSSESPPSVPSLSCVQLCSAAAHLISSFPSRAVIILCFLPRSVFLFLFFI